MKPALAAFFLCSDASIELCDSSLRDDAFSQEASGTRPKKLPSQFIFLQKLNKLNY